MASGIQLNSTNNSEMNIVYQGTSGATRTVVMPDKDMTVAGVDEVLGVGQTYIPMTIGTDRSANTDYTNNTGKPIMVIVSVTATSTADTISPIVGGVTLAITNSAVSGSETPVTFIVPNGLTYRVNLTNATMYRWTELR